MAHAAPGVAVVFEEAAGEVRWVRVGSLEHARPRANPQPRPPSAATPGRPELRSVGQWLVAWRTRATEAQRSAQRGSMAGAAGHFQCQPLGPIRRTGLVWWGNGLGWGPLFLQAGGGMSLRLPPPVVTSFPHQAGLGAQPGRDESSLGPSVGLTRGPEPDSGEGCGGRRTGAAGLWPGGWRWGAGRCVDEQGWVGSGWGKRGRVWG